MLNIKNEKRHRLAVRLICEKLGIDNKELNAFIEKGAVKPLEKPAPKKVKK